MTFVAKEEALDAELDRYGLRHHTAGRDSVKSVEEAGDVFLRLIFTPSVTGV